MNNNYLLYIESFKKFEPSIAEIGQQYPNLSNYSTFINNKANEIFLLASADLSIDSMELQKEILDLGKRYVKTFVAIHKQNSKTIDRGQIV